VTGLAHHRDDLIDGRRVVRVMLALLRGICRLTRARSRRASAAWTNRWTDDMAPSFKSRKRLTAHPNRVRSGAKGGSRDGCIWAIPIVRCGAECSASPERHKCDVANAVAGRPAGWRRMRSSA